MLLLGVFDTVFGGVMDIPTAAIISVVGFLIVFAVLAILAIFVFGQGKLFDAILSRKTKKSETAAAPVQTVAPVTAPVQEPVVTVTSSEDNIPDQDIAVIIAIVCNQSGIPLNKLRINSIKLLEDK